ncbi:MAG: family 1 glycosylhydrolase, partial [Candidatus Moraniibacteriota bacterium]
MKNNILTFPKNFYWGSSTSAHQVEGNNHNDWTEWEKENAERLAKEAKDKYQKWQVKKFPEMLRPKNYISGRACDHYNHYEEDFDIAKSLNHNAHRFSIEWSRIEPEEGKFDEKEIEHYRKVLKALKKRGLEPFVTLWHWPNPIWIRDNGGWGNKKTIEYFIRYVNKIADELGNNIKFWIPINEPALYAAWSYITGYFPPQRKNLFSAMLVMKNLISAHKKVYMLLHEKLGDSVEVGSTSLYHNYLPYNKYNPLDQIITKIIYYFGDVRTTNWAKNYGDFVGLNGYFTSILKFSPWGGKYPLVDQRNPNTWVSDLGWYIYPEGIYHVLKDLKTRYDKPVYITENGLADKDDKSRKKFIEKNLFWMHKAMSEGVDVKGYFHWSLLDNFEWD